METYRSFDKFPFKWKTRDSTDRVLQGAIGVSVGIVVFALGAAFGSSTTLPAEKPLPPKPDRAMCYDTVFTEPNDHYAYKCPFWDQTMHTITLKGAGAVACKCPGSKSLSEH